MSQPLPKPRAAIVQEIDYDDPARLVLRLKGRSHVLLLDSALRHERLGRYSFLTCDPSQRLRVTAGRSFLNDEPVAGSALPLLSRCLREQPLIKSPDLPPFQGGFAGYIAYDFGRRLEPKAKVSKNPSPVPELMLNRYDAVVGFDHIKKRSWVLGLSEEAVVALQAALQAPVGKLGSSVCAGFQSNFTQVQFEAAVARTRDYILAGDIFQANIAQCFKAQRPDDFDALALYLKLRDHNPAPFSVYLDFGGVQVASSSPERLFAVDGDRVETRPIKGTRRRDADASRDADLVAELISSRKDRAENVMIVDLLRNDLSRVCLPGSVQVPVLCGLESYAAVHHLTSVVEGRLRAGLGACDVLASLFPGGSITGAPKVRAMEVISEIEGCQRGVYCGSIGYIGFDGRADFNIAIRTVECSQGEVRVSGGGGITARSEPSAEYDETMVKLTRVLRAFRP